MSQLRQQEQTFESLGVHIYVVTFDADFLAKAYVTETGMRWPLLIDSQRSLYNAYSMLAGTWWAIIRPSSIWGYLKLLFRGHRLHKSGRDYRQLGGDVLIDPDGLVRVHHISTGPHDRPTVESLLEAIGRPAGQG